MSKMCFYFQGKLNFLNNCLKIKFKIETPKALQYLRHPDSIYCLQCALDIVINLKMALVTGYRDY